MFVLKNPAHFNLRTIMNSGQCFRIFEPMPDVYDVLAAGKWVRVYHDSFTNTYTFDCGTQEFFEWWVEYFDLKTNYESYFNTIKYSNDEFLKKAAEYGNGMRILRQSYWETIVSFIISQNNNIPRIKKSIEAFCKKFGRPITRYGTTYYMFPDKINLKEFRLEDLEDLGLGYRAKYIYEVCVCDPVHYAPDNLSNVTGIGPKVESCIRLFGLHQMDSYPVDTWMKKLIDEVYDGHFDTIPYKGFEGFIQQLQFYYYRHLKGKRYKDG